MAMVYTLVSTAKEWLSEKFYQNAGDKGSKENQTGKDEMVILNGEPVTGDTYLARVERYEPKKDKFPFSLRAGTSFSATKKKTLKGAASKSAALVDEGSDEEMEDV